MTRALPVLFLALLACDETKEDIDNDVWPYCEDAETQIAPEDETDIGVTGADLLDALPTSTTADMTWSGDISDSLTWGFSADTDTLRFVESTAVYPEPEEGQDVPSIGVECPNYVAVDGILNLQSDDGQLNEAVALTVSLDEYETAAAGFFVELDPDALGGTLDLSDYLDVGAYDDPVRLFLSGEITDSVLSGYLSAQGSGTDGDVAFAENITIASFGEE